MDGEANAETICTDLYAGLGYKLCALYFSYCCSVEESEDLDNPLLYRFVQGMDYKNRNTKKCPEGPKTTSFRGQRGCAGQVEALKS